MGQQVAEGVAVRCVPLEHAGELVLAPPDALVVVAPGGGEVIFKRAVYLI
jgi:hypothetical protein